VTTTALVQLLDTGGGVGVGVVVPVGVDVAVVVTRRWC
jgi:hypothetical protein